MEGYYETIAAAAATRSYEDDGAYHSESSTAPMMGHNSDDVNGCRTAIVVALSMVPYVPVGDKMAVLIDSNSYNQ